MLVGVLYAALHPLASLLGMSFLIYLIYSAGLILRVLLLFLFALTYFVIGPRAKRNVGMWTAISPPRGNRRGANQRAAVLDSMDTSDGKHRIAVSIPLGDSDVVRHAVAFTQAPYFSQSTSMYVCNQQTGSHHSWRQRHQDLLFYLPVARLALWMIGGLMQYSRGLLLQLLKRRSPVVAIVLLPSLIQESGGRCSLELACKGVFAAALKGAAVVVPVLVDRNGVAWHGGAVKLVDCKEAVAVPSADQVRGLSAAFSQELQKLHLEITSKPLDVFQ